MVLVDARTQHRLIDQLFSVPKCVRLSRMSERSHELLRKMLRAVPERSRDELEEIVGDTFVKWGEGNISEFQKKKAKGIMSSDFPMMDEKDETHQTMMEIEPLLVASGYRTWRNVQEMAVPTSEQLSRVSISKKLDLFRTTCIILRIPKEIEKIWTRQS